MIKVEPFGAYEKIVCENEILSVGVLTYGCTTQSLCVHGKEMLLQYEDAEGYVNGDAYIGATVGRYANRIAGASFSLNGKTYVLDKNEKENQLHGGTNAFDKRIWDYEIIDENRVRFHLFSPDGDNGYPGNLDAYVLYTIEGNTLTLTFEATSDQDTIYAPTTHMYFHFGKNKTILDTQLEINADTYLPVDENLIPTGRVPVDETFDFRMMRPIRQNYDHCFVLNDKKAATAQAGNLRMEIETDYPGIQLYAGEFLSGKFQPNEGFALEPEFFPNSPNTENAPILRAHDTYHKYVKYTFLKD